MSTPQIWFSKDPNDVLDYMVNAATWLGTDTISSVSWTVPTGLTKDSQSNTTTTATIWVSGGTVGTEYEVLCRVVTAGGKTKDWTIGFTIEQH